MRIASLVLLGAVCLTKLPIDLLPKISLPTVAVNTTWTNVAPEQMETQITRPIEEAVSQAPGVYTVSSTTIQGQSTVRVQFNWGVDIGQAAIDTLQLVERARQNFPVDPTLQTPIVFKYDPSTLPIMIYGVSGIDDPVKLRTLLDNEVTPILESANGVASATATGGLQRAIIVDVDPIKLRSYGLSLQDVQSRIVQENINLPAGIARQSDTEYLIRAVGYFKSPQEAGQIPLGTHDGHVVTLNDVAKVRDSYQEQRIATRLNGKPSVGVTIIKQSAANTVSTAAAVRDKLTQVAKLYPELKWGLAYDQSGFIANSIEDLKFEAAVGGLLAVFVLMLFLRNVRSTLVVGLSIPISIVSTFALLYFCGFTLNTISLSGLALASGLIVDDAVVVIENIFRHIERDKRKATEAAVTGTDEIFSAVVASTLTIIIVFFPLLLIQGQAGQTFAQFAYVVIFSILVSLLDATTVVPMLASRLIKEEEVEEEIHPELRAQRGKKTTWLNRIFDACLRGFTRMDSGYHRVLEWALHHRWVVIGVATFITFASLFLYPLIGSELLPQTDSGDFQVQIKHPVGTAFAKTNQTMLQVEDLLNRNPDVETVFSAAGANLGLRGNANSPSSFVGAATVRLKENRKHSTQEVVAQLQKQLGQIPGIRGIATPYDLVTTILTGGNTNMEVDVFGANYDQLFKSANQVLDAMKGVPGLEGVDLNIQEKTPEVQFNVDREKALSLGITYTDIGNVLETATNGALSSYYQENGFQYPIYTQVPEIQRKTLEDLVNLPITPSVGPGGKGLGNEAKPVLLGQVATPVIKMGLNEVDRLNRQRYIAVTGRVAGRSVSEIQDDISKKLASVQLPKGSYWDFGIDIKRRAGEFAGLGLAVGMAIALIYMLLASQFESFVYPLVILASAPLSISGVLVALFLSGRAFGLTAFIGLLMLIGIVVKNGILLVDYTNQLRSRGMRRDEAVLTASPTRLRPILMTSAAAILGMIPIALALGRGSETQAPLATAVVGGLITSTLLTLLVVPCVYTLLDDLQRRITKTEKDLHPSELVGPTLGETGAPIGGFPNGHSPTKDGPAPDGPAPDGLAEPTPTRTEGGPDA
jgi:HAE1 family hydrophobic/amphiphilic exporter-1